MKNKKLFVLSILSLVAAVLLVVSVFSVLGESELAIFYFIRLPQYLVTPYFAWFIYPIVALVGAVLFVVNGVFGILRATKGTKAVKVPAKLFAILSFAMGLCAALTLGLLLLEERDMQGFASSIAYFFVYPVFAWVVSALYKKELKKDETVKSEDTLAELEAKVAAMEAAVSAENTEVKAEEDAPKAE